MLILNVARAIEWRVTRGSHQDGPGALGAVDTRPAGLLACRLIDF
jgi:hypothetical protein